MVFVKINRCKVCASTYTSYLCVHCYGEHCEYSRYYGFHEDIVQLTIMLATLSSFLTCYWICRKSITIS